MLGSARELGATVLVGQLIFTTYAFAWLRQRTAMFISGVTYLLLWTPRGPMAALDRPALLLTGFAMSLVWFLSQYGWHVYTERNQKEAFAALAYRDYLTGIANRSAGRQVLDRLFSEPAGTGSGLCVALCDIDHFKRINDTVGHHRGDDVLIEVARVLQETAEPAGGLAARWGGEEFLIILPGHTLESAQKVVSQALTTIKSGSFPEHIRVTLSAGVAGAREAADVPALLRLADSRLYAAKDGGRDQLR